MKKLIISTTFLALSLCFSFYAYKTITKSDISLTNLVSGKVEAQSQTTQQISREDILAGLWRNGQAVFSDIPILDVLIKDKYARGHKPEQPVNYSHVIHVKQNGIECQYCHSGVAKSSYATMPPLELCMGCHNVVKTDSPEIKKLAEAWNNNQPIEWIPVHNLPEHANFNHQRHIKAGVGCQNCHGQVQNMDVVERVSTLKMGFCVSCHRDQGVSIDCGLCHY